MTFEAYLSLCEKIVNNTQDLNEPPYNDDLYYEYTKMNLARMNRWLKTGKIDLSIHEKISSISENQTWILITEPWCGDAAHSVPFIYLLSQLNSKINLEIELRDQAPHRIDNYLTNGSKSIPILILKNANGEDMIVWGPRPKDCQDLFLNLKESGLDMEDIKLKIQQWYNDDKGQSILQEITNELI